jgi:hypothetical protein
MPETTEPPMPRPGLQLADLRRLQQRENTRRGVREAQQRFHSLQSRAFQAAGLSN